MIYREVRLTELKPEHQRGALGALFLPITAARRIAVVAVRREDLATAREVLADLGTEIDCPVMVVPEDTRLSMLEIDDPDESWTDDGRPGRAALEAEVAALRARVAELEGGDPASASRRIA